MYASSLHSFQKTTTKLLSMTFILLAFTFSTKTTADEFTFTVQPILSSEKTRQFYQPLTDYLSKHTGHTFKVVAERNFLSYWYKMKKRKYDLILDAAHFTDFRINHLNYSVLAKLPENVSFSLITNSKNLIFDHTELIGKTLVTQPSPSMGAAKLHSLYSSPTRQPLIITIKSAAEAIKAVQSGKYYSALVPTPLLKNKQGIHIISTTEPIPHMAISASNNIDKKLQEKIKNILIDAKKTQSGQALLQKIGLSEFSQTTAKTYKGYEKYLAGMMGSSRSRRTR